MIISIKIKNEKTYENTSEPHPAIAENNRGLKSRAGFIGPPQLKPKANTRRPKSVTPMAIGTKPDFNYNKIGNELNIVKVF